MGRRENNANKVSKGKDEKIKKYKNATRKEVKKSQNW